LGDQFEGANGTQNGSEGAGDKVRVDGGESGGGTSVEGLTHSLGEPLDDAGNVPSFEKGVKFRLGDRLFDDPDHGHESVPKVRFESVSYL